MFYLARLDAVQAARSVEGERTNRAVGKSKVTGTMRISPCPSSSNTVSLNSGSTTKLTRFAPWRNPENAQTYPHRRPVSYGLSSPKRPATCKDTNRTHLAMSRMNLNTLRMNPLLFSNLRKRFAEARAVLGGVFPGESSDSACAVSGRRLLLVRSALFESAGVNRSRPNNHPIVILPVNASLRTIEKEIVTGMTSSKRTKKTMAAGMISTGSMVGSTFTSLCSLCALSTGPARIS